jgi:NADH-quinone oxidoreductase subunit K
MTGIPMEHGLAFAAMLFTLGLAGLMVRRNLLFMLMCMEVMMNAAALAFVMAGSTGASRTGRSCSS